VKVALHAGQLLQPVPGGIGRYVRSLLAALPDAGVTPVPFAAGSLPGAVDLGWPRGPLRYEAWHRLRRPVVRVEGDVVHAPSLAVPPVQGRPLVVTVHDLVFLRQPEHLTARGVSFHRRGLELARRDAAVIVVPTEFGKADLAREGVDPDRIHVAPHGVAPATPSDLPPPVDGPYVLFVSTLEPRKGVDDLLDAHAALRARHPDLQLVLAGPAGWGPPPDTDRPGVVVVGNLDEPALDSAYRHGLALVVPERYAGFGLPIIEGMARGCPVITSDAACLPEVGGGATVVVPTGDVGALADALDELVASEARRRELTTAGLARSAEFTWARSAALHRAAYEAALS